MSQQGKFEYDYFALYQNKQHNFNKKYILIVKTEGTFKKEYKKYNFILT